MATVQHNNNIPHGPTFIMNQLIFCYDIMRQKKVRISTNAHSYRNHLCNAYEKHILFIFMNE